MPRDDPSDYYVNHMIKVWNSDVVVIKDFLARLLEHRAKMYEQEKEFLFAEAAKGNLRPELSLMHKKDPFRFRFCIAGTMRALITWALTRAPMEEVYEIMISNYIPLGAYARKQGQPQLVPLVPPNFKKTGQPK